MPAVRAEDRESASALRTQIHAPHPDSVIGTLGAAQHGVVAHRQLLAADVAPSMIRRRIASGHLIQLHRGIYAVGHQRLRREGHWLAAVLAVGPGAVLSHRNAAALHGIRSVAASQVDVSTNRQRGAQAGIRVYGRRTLHADEITVVDAIPVTTVARTLVDLAALVSPQQLERTISESERMGSFDLTALERSLRRTRGRRGPGHKTRLVVELDGYASHHHRRAFQNDRTKANDLTAAGYAVLRFTYSDVTRRPADVAARITRATATAPPLPRSARRAR